MTTHSDNIPRDFRSPAPSEPKGPTDQRGSGVGERTGATATAKRTRDGHESVPIHGAHCHCDGSRSRHRPGYRGMNRRRRGRVIATDLAAERLDPLQQDVGGELVNVEGDLAEPAVIGVCSTRLAIVSTGSRRLPIGGVSRSSHSDSPDRSPIGSRTRSRNSGTRARQPSSRLIRARSVSAAAGSPCVT